MLILLLLLNMLIAPLDHGKPHKNHTRRYYHRQYVKTQKARQVSQMEHYPAWKDLKNR